ncbi:hypothetical protein PA598K_04605 [Paenibacillus sp. 598K]|uniref:fibronectin type III domain-containing protein n=1 Tax=Paenibacillus sp. 598K TaxID=1117987 RepID=UPI000FF9B3D8|nr:fibronectin type III domain-containing protein [Paenibacillus sp. 598K]GBF76157.1 hypothetical protein PA598K_04605 [Paenibacillus sp. 598K]
MTTLARRQTVAILIALSMLLSLLAPAAFATVAQAEEGGAGGVPQPETTLQADEASQTAQAAPVAAPAQVEANWYTTYQTMDGVGAAYAYTPSIHMMQLATAGHQDKVRRLLDLTFDERDGTGHDIARVIIGDNGGLTATGTAASPGFNPATGLLADVANPGFDIEGHPIPRRGTAGQYGYKIEAENRYYDGNTDSIWPVEPDHAPGTLVPLEGFVWEYDTWERPIANDIGGPTNLVGPRGEDPVIHKDGPRTRKELFDFDQVWTMRQAMQYGVDQFYACVWTVPYWMSNSNANAPGKIVRGDTAIIDGKPVKIYYQAFADYLVYYIKGMWEQWGIPITHIGPFNEVDLAGGTAVYVTEIINDYIGPTLKRSVEPGGALHDIVSPEGKTIDFVPELVAVDGTNLNASISRGGQAFAQVDEATATPKNPYLDVFSTHLYGTVGIGTDERKLYHTGDFSQSPLDYTTAGNRYPEYLTRYKLWQTEFMNQDTGDGSAGAYTNRYGNQNINDAVRWSNLMTNMFTSNPGFNGFIWWSMWDSNGVDGSDLIRFVTSNSQQEPGRISTLTGEYRIFKRFYSFGHFSRFMNRGDVRFDVTRAPAEDINIVAFRPQDHSDFAITVSNARNDDSIQPLAFTLKDFPKGTASVTVFRTSGHENQQKLGTIPVQDGKFVIDIPSASVVTIVPSDGRYATFNSLGGERDIFSSLEAEAGDNGVRGDAQGAAGRPDEAVTLHDGGYLAYRNVNFADGSANGGVVRRHLLYLTAQAKAAKGGRLSGYVLPVGTEAASVEDIVTKGRKVAEIAIPANARYGSYQTMVATGDLSAYGHKDLYLVADTDGASDTIVIDRFLFGANDGDWSAAGNNSVVAIPGNLLRNGDFDTVNAASAEHWSTGRYEDGTFATSVTGPVLAADTIQSYSGLSRYLKNSSGSRVAGSGKLSGRIDAELQYDGIWQDLTGKLTPGESYDFKGYFLSMQHRPESYDHAADHPGDVEVALAYYDAEGESLGLTRISGRDMPEPYPAREAGDPGFWRDGRFVGRILEGGPLSLSSFQPLMVKVADWHESDSESFVYSEPAGTARVVLAIYAKDANILYADQLSVTPASISSYTIFVDGEQLSGFDPARTSYTHTVSGDRIPVVTAVSSDRAEIVSVSQADSPQGTAVVRFIKGQTTRTYTIALSTTQYFDFASGLPAGWEVADPENPADPLQAISFTETGGVAVRTYKGDSDYPASRNRLQLPGTAQGDWTLTATLTVDKPLSDASHAELSQVGLGLHDAGTGEFYRVNARKVGSNIKVNNSGRASGANFNNTTNQTNLFGTVYEIRIVKTGNVVQGYFKPNANANWMAMGNSSTYTDAFASNARVYLYGANFSNATDLNVTFSSVSLVKTLAEPGEGGEDQLAVEQAAALIGASIEVPHAGSDEPEALRASAQAYLDALPALQELGVIAALAYDDGRFLLRLTRGAASIERSLTVSQLTVEDEQAPTWPEGSELTAADITATTVSLSWTAAADDTGVAAYKVYQGEEELATLPGDAGSYTAALLTPETAYTFRVEAGDAAGNWSASGPTTTATTLAAPDDDEAPTWPEGSALTASEITASSVTLSWTAAEDDLGVTGYTLYQGEEELATVSGLTLTYTVDGLTPETTYTYRVEAGDVGGNWTTDGPSVEATTAPAPVIDAEAPTWPEGSALAATDVSTTALTLSWTEAADDTGVTSYTIYNGSQTVATVAGDVTTYRVSGLAQGTSYTFTVQAGDAAGNWSTDGPAATVTTRYEPVYYQPVPWTDTIAPTWPEGSELRAADIAQTALTLSWPAASDASGVTGYRIYEGDRQLASVAAGVTSYAVTDLAPGMSYTFAVQAGDAAGNWSKAGPTVTVSTLPIAEPAEPETPVDPERPQHRFTDLDGRFGWAAEAIAALYTEGIVRGTSETTFEPARPVSRADFVVLLVRALGLTAEGRTTFTDVSPSDYYYEAVGIAQELGLVQGVDGRAFHPRGEITRQDMMVIVARALQAMERLSMESDGDLSRFVDGSQVAAYARDAVAALVELDVIQGDGAAIRPLGTATRAETAVIIYRIYRML